MDIATIAGLIGALAGIYGAITGHISLKRTSTYKKTDLRLELRKAENELQSKVEELPPQMQCAKKSREAVLNAKGMYHSGARKRWVQEWEQDISAVEALISELPDRSIDYQSLDHRALEERHVSVHKQSIRANNIHSKYQTSIAEDDESRRQIQAAIHATIQPK